MQPCSVKYLITGDLFILKTYGKLRFNLAPCLEKALDILNASKACKQVIIDMTETPYVDSTILGQMINFFYNEAHDRLNNARPIIVCDDGDLKKILYSIGFDQFFNVQAVDERIDSTWEKYLPIEDGNSDKTQLEKYVKRSHETLKALQPGTRDFDLVVKAIKNDPSY
jgi:anti-anti-sigma regulatory factor